MHPSAPARRTPTPPWLNDAATWVMLCVALMLVLIGIAEPALRLETAWLFEDAVSLADGIGRFFQNGQEALGVFVLFVTGVLPVLKIVAACVMLTALPRESEAAERGAGVLGFLSRWSMTDVFILAVVILVIDGQVLSRANLAAGAYVFAAGVLLSSVAVERIRGRARRALKARVTAHVPAPAIDPRPAAA